MKIARLDAFPAFPAAIGAATGVMAMEYPWLWIFAGLFFILLILCRVRIVPALLFIVMLSVTAVRVAMMAPGPADTSLFDGRERVWRGTVESVRATDRSQRCVLAVDSPAVLRCRLMIADITPELRSGDIVSVKGVLECAGKYDAAPSLGYRGDRSDRVVANMLDFTGNCTVVGHSGSLWYRLQDVRGRLAAYVSESPLDAPTSRLLAAAVLGGGDVGDDRKEAFRAGGLSHLLCVSGFHVAVFAMVVAFLLFPLRLAEHAGRSRYLIVIMAVWLYAIATGLMPSVFRAAVMLTVYNMALFFQRNSPPFNSLCLAVVIILVVNPLWMFSIGFQLSVLAVLGLLILPQKLIPVGRRNPFYVFAALFAVPLSVALATAPVLLVHFHSLPLLTVPVNALASLVFPLFMILGMAVVCLSAIGLPVAWAARTVDGLAAAIDSICNMAVSAPWAYPGGIVLGPWRLAALCAALAAFVLLLYSRRGLQRILGALAVLLCCVAVWMLPGVTPVRDIAIHGNSSVAEIRVRCDGRGFVIPLAYSKRPIGPSDSYFMEGGVAPDSVEFGSHDINHPVVVRAADMLHVADRRILIASTDSSGVPGRVDAVVLRRRYRGNLDSLIVRNNPGAVVLCPDMDADRREAYAAAAAAAGVAVYDLCREIFVSDF